MKDEKDMIRIKNKFYILYEYFGKKYGDESALDPFKNIIDNAFEKKELRKLKSIDKELNTWIREERCRALKKKNWKSNKSLNKN